MEEDQAVCVNSTGASCTAFKCECHGIDIKEVRVKSPAERASDKIVKFEKWIEEENKKRRKVDDEDRYLPQIIKEDFYRDELFYTLIKQNEKEDENKSNS